jgi:hypothetical protein
MPSHPQTGSKISIHTLSKSISVSSIHILGVFSLSSPPEQAKSNKAETKNSFFIIKLVYNLNTMISLIYLKALESPELKEEDMPMVYSSE